MYCSIFCCMFVILSSVIGAVVEMSLWIFENAMLMLSSFVLNINTWSRIFSLSVCFNVVFRRCLVSCLCTSVLKYLWQWFPMKLRPWWACGVILFLLVHQYNYRMWNLKEKKNHIKSMKDCAALPFWHMFDKVFNSMKLWAIFRKSVSVILETTIMITY